VNTHQRLKRNARKRARNRRKHKRIAERRETRKRYRLNISSLRWARRAIVEADPMMTYYHNPHDYTVHCPILDILRPDQITLIAERMALKHIRYNIQQARRERRLIDLSARAEIQSATAAQEATYVAALVPILPIQPRPRGLNCNTSKT